MSNWYSRVGSRVPSSDRGKFRFVVLGAGRGGTSLFAALLDAHPGLEVGFEEHARSMLVGEDLPGVAAVDRVQKFRAACDAMAARHPPSMWGNKVTTEQIGALGDYGADPMGLFLGGVGDVKVAFVLRDGRSCIASKVARTGQAYDTAVRFWRFSVEVFRRVEGAGGVTVRFEDLVTNPVPELRRVCDHLGVRYSPRMLKGTTNRKMRAEYRQEGLDAAKAAPAKLPDQVLAEIEPELRLLGYL